MIPPPGPKPKKTKNPTQVELEALWDLMVLAERQGYTPNEYETRAKRLVSYRKLTDED